MPGNKYIKILYLSILTLAASLGATANHVLRSTVYTAADGLPCNTTGKLLKDSNGYLWICTNSGLCRYDGYTFKNISLTPQLQNTIKDKHIYNVCEDKLGRLWITTYTNSIFCYDKYKATVLPEADNYNGKGNLQYALLTSAGMVLTGKNKGFQLLYVSGNKVHKRTFSKSRGNIASDNITCVSDNNDGNIWIGTSRGLFIANANGIQQKALPHRSITAMARHNGCLYILDSENMLHVLSANGKITQTSVCPPEKGSFAESAEMAVSQNKLVILTKRNIIRYDMNSRKFDILYSDSYAAGMHLIKSFGNEFWATDNKGTLWHFDKDGKRTAVTIKNGSKAADDNNRINIVSDGEGAFFISTYSNGLFYYNPQTGRQAHFSTANSSMIYNNSIYDMLHYDSGCLWLSGEAGLLNISKSDINYNVIMPQATLPGDKSYRIRNICTLPDGTIEFSTYDGTTHSIANGNNSTPHVNGHYSHPVYSRLATASGEKWTGTKGGGLWINNTHYKKGDAKHDIPSNDIYDMVRDRKGRTWIATLDGGLLLAQPAANGYAFTQYLCKDSNQKSIRDLYLDNNGHLWIATMHGIYILDVSGNKINAEQMINYSRSNATLSSNETVKITGDLKGNVYVGTMNDGVMYCTVKEDYRHITFKSINTQYGLASDVVRSMEVDNHGYVWIAGDGGLARFSPMSGIINKYNFGADILSSIYVEGSSGKSADGDLYFGTYKGIMHISPTGGESSTDQDIIISDIIVNGTQETAVSLQDSTPTVRLKHNENNIGLRFSNLDFNNFNTTIYRYRLEGWDKEWIQTSDPKSAYYANMPPGEYIFHVMALGSGGWGKETTLHINILKPWWQTWAFRIPLFIAVTAILLIIGKTTYSNAKLRQQMRIDKEMTDFRINFFTQISHEFRTPLSLIISAIDQITDGKNNVDAKNQAAIAHRGAWRMQKLIRQLTEFRKANSGNMKINVEPTEIVAFVRDICHEHTVTALQKEQTLTFTPTMKTLTLLVDREKVDSVINNLLSNALKYTPANGTINIGMKTTDNGTLEIAVADTGPGIGCNQADKLFKPFMHGYVSQGGMGIGLFMASQYAKSHKGGVRYERAGNEGGSCFTLWLPLSDSAYSAEDKLSVFATGTGTIETARIEKSMPAKPFNDFTAYIAEDDDDMRQQMAQTLSAYMRVKAFANGQLCADAVTAATPHIVISDVVMPDMSGFELVNKLKQEHPNLPVILLSGLSDTKDRIKGLENGADDYMSKPCNYHELAIRALKLIDKADMSENAKTPYETQKAMIYNQGDKKFKEKFEIIVEQNLESSFFSVNDIVERMNVSRSQLYNRIKILEGMPPSEYIRNKRLDLAAGLILSGKHSLQDIRGKVGIPDASQFNVAFKRKFGVAPSKYGKEQPARQ